MRKCIIQVPDKEIATDSCMMFSNHFTENDQINEKHDQYDKFSTCEVTLNIEKGGGLSTNDQKRNQQVLYFDSILIKSA